MHVTIFGVQDLDFTTPEGSNIKGKSIFVGFNNRYVQGLKTNKYFISSDIPSCKDLSPDMDCDLVFNDKGKIEDISIL